MDHDARWSHQQSLVAEPLSVVRARWFVGRCLLDHDQPSIVQDVQLVASELATNAIEHAMSPFTVVLQGFDDFVFLAVHDGSLKRPRLLTNQPLDSEVGRGMVLVNALSSDWGMAATPKGGKSTWAAFDTQSAAPHPQRGWVGAPYRTCRADRDSAGQVETSTQPGQLAELTDRVRTDLPRSELPSGLRPGRRLRRRLRRKVPLLTGATEVRAGRSPLSAAKAFASDRV